MSEPHGPEGADSYSLAFCICVPSHMTSKPIFSLFVVTSPLPACPLTKSYLSSSFQTQNALLAPRLRRHICQSCLLLEENKVPYEEEAEALKSFSSSFRDVTFVRLFLLQRRIRPFVRSRPRLTRGATRRPLHSTKKQEV